MYIRKTTTSLFQIGQWLNNRTLLLTIIFVGTYLSAQAQIQVNKVYGNPCVGNQMVFALMGGSCSATWYSNGTIISQNSSSATVVWNSPTSNAYVWANYSCSSYPYNGTAYSPSYNITNLVAPSVSIVANNNNVCKTTNITFTATPVNGGSTPYYSWRVNGNTVSSGSSNTWASNGSLNNNDVVSVVMSTTAPCVTTSTATSNNITMTLTTPSPVSVTIYGPSTICTGSSGGVSFYATPTNGGSSPTYTWLKNGYPVSDNSPTVPVYIYAPQNPLNNGDVIKCQVTSNQSCVSGNPAESNEYVVSLTSATNPTIGVQIPHYVLCDQQTINFTASGTHITGSSTYSWRLNGNQFSTASAASLPVSLTEAPNTFGPGDVVTVVVSGLSGTCLTTTTATGSTSGVPWVFNPLPSASTTPGGNVKTNSDQNLNITAASGSGYSYQWYFNDTPIVGAPGTVNPYTATNVGTYRVSVTGPGNCTTMSSLITYSRNSRPVANAGANPEVLVLPVNSIVLYGSGNDGDGNIQTYLWSQASGPSQATLSGSTTNELTASDLTTGTYQFQLVVTDDFGEASLPDIVIVTVQEPPNNYNWIRETLVMQEGITTEGQIDGLQITDGEKAVSYTYFDGLGRPMQQVGVQSSPQGWDVVQPVIYDKYGREEKKYLPYTSNQTNGWYKLAPTGTGSYSSYLSSAQYQFYQQGGTLAQDTVPYAKSIFEPSPLNRVLEQTAPGESWRSTATTGDYSSLDRTVKMAYETNAASEVRRWTYTYPTTAYPLGLVNAGTAASPVYYEPNTLYKTKTRDEQYNEVIEYKDKQGRVVLKRVQAVEGTPTVPPPLNDTNYASTYYVYDDFGNLVCVIPPEATKQLATQYFQAGATDNTKNEFLKRWAFRYAYDARKRMTQKQVPGADPIYMVYDDRDRLVLTQDGVQRPLMRWQFTKYDLLNRPILTGLKDTTVVLSQADMQSAVNAHYIKPWAKWGESYVGNVAGNTHGYSCKSFPVLNYGGTSFIAWYFTATYYDNYDFKNLAPLDYEYVNEGLTETRNSIVYSQPPTASVQVKGQVTGTQTRLIDSQVTAGTYTFLTSVNYYDDKYRVIQTISDNYRGGIDRATNLYDFAGKVLETKTIHYGLTFRDLAEVKFMLGKIIKTGTNGWNAGAASKEILPANQDGWVEMIAFTTNKAMMLGFSETNPNANWNSIKYALYLTNGGKVEIREAGSGNLLIPTVSYAAGDKFRVERKQGKINYYRNGSLLLQRNATSNAMMVDMSIHDSAGQLNYLRSSLGGFNPHQITRRLEYDHAGRLVNTWHKLNSQSEILLSQNKYNESGQLIDKKLHSTVSTASDAKQSVDYRYNIRGWLTSLNNASLVNDATNDDTGDLFGFELGYDTDIGAGNTGLFNGNISGLKWSNNAGFSTIKEKAYTYGYDPMNRISSAGFKEKESSWNTASNSGFSVTGFTYDLNGNIQSLTRYDERGTTAPMDNLIYDYGTGTTQGNKLLKVSEKTGVGAGDKFKGFIDGDNTGNDYSYDANGNMLTDQNKGITSAIAYHFHNLPMTITKGGNTLYFVYDVLGRKLAQLMTYANAQPSKETTYAGEYQFENGTLQFINHEEGRIVMTNETALITSDGSSLANLTGNNGATADLVTQNGNQSYIRITSNGTQWGGLRITTGIPAAPAEQYKIRIKGYRTASTDVNILIKTNLGNLYYGSNNWYGARLPHLAANEAWIEQTVVIPTGANVLYPYLQFNTSSSGSQFFVNDVEIIKLESAPTPEYQYHLKDHLGNVRVTFTSKEEADEATATLETANMNEEQSKFLRYQHARRVYSHLFDRTNGTFPTTTPGYAQRLTGTTNEKYGLAKSLSVIPGDKINIEVHAKYVDSDTATWTTALETLIGQIASGSAGTVVDGGAYGSSTSTFPFPTEAVANTAGSSGLGPKAYLNWLVFDRDYNLIVEQCGYDRLSDQPKEHGQDAAYEQLVSPEIIISEPGYVYIYLSNEETTPVEVYFDDFSVEHIKSPIVQQDNYYPFGLTFNSYSRESGKPNDYKYNGKEEQSEIGLGWLDYGRRMYQPEIGKFFTVDRFAEKYCHISSYSYAGNNPVNLVDINGDSLWISYAGNNILYQNGGLYNKDGTAYTGKGAKIDKNGNVVGYKGFLGQAFNALNTLAGTAEGASLVGELQGSNNNFNIEQSTTNEFAVNGGQRTAAYANQLQTDPQYAGQLATTPAAALQGGAGGTIRWDPNGANVWVLGGAQNNNPASNLGHELFHARDANRGLMDGRTWQGLKYDEWQATFKENQIRLQMGLPLREYYRTQSNNGVLSPLAPRVLDATNQPIRPAWVQGNY